MTAQKNGNGNQSGGGSGSGNNQNSGGGQSSGQGQYSDTRMDPNHEDYDPNWQPGPVGAVEDPENDGRLKENRDQGRTKGTTEHSAQAPHVDRDDSNSINNSGGNNSGGSQFGGNNQGGGNR